MTVSRNIRVFVSYAHEVHEPAATLQRSNVTGLVEDLRANGVDTEFDRDINGTPKQGWPAWMESKVADATFVLLVCTATYLRRYELRETPGAGKGATWEGAIVRQELYDASALNEKFAAILFSREDVAFIPMPLRPHTYYRYPEDRIKLLRWLTDQAEYLPKPLGTKPVLPPVP